MAINILGYGQKTTANPSIPINLASGGAFVIPAGQYQVTPGAYTFLQWFDPITLMWRTMGTPAQSDPFALSSDGNNYRLFNATGTMVGASVTNAGSGYTNGIYPPNLQLGTATAPSVTMSAGGGVAAKPTLIVGGAINTTVAFTGGSGYTLPPTLVVSPPPPGGVPATMYATISGGAVTGVTVTNAGAGYTTAPTVTVVTANGDLTGTGATVTVNATLAGSGTVTAITIQGNVVMPNNLSSALIPQNGVFPTTAYTGGFGGSGMTSVPTFTFSPASTTAATALMCFTCTTVTLSGETNATVGNIVFMSTTAPTAQSTNTNPAITTGLFTPRLGYTASSTTAITTTTILDGGLHMAAPAVSALITSTGTISGAVTVATNTYGGTTDISYLEQI